MQPRWDLSQSVSYDKGRNFAWQVAWQLVSGLIFIRWWCPPQWRPWILRAFGAKVGKGVYIKPSVRVHWPWRLTIGDNSWIGERAWILNLVQITIGSHSVISQEALLCTGSHDLHSPNFKVANSPITIGDGVWVAARATVLSGITINDNATVGATALVTKDVGPGSFVLAPAAMPVRNRRRS